MIAHIKGKIIHKSPEAVIVDVAGIGYEVHIPLSTYYGLPDMHEHISLHTHTHVREDALQLFGFLTLMEKEIFQLLLNVSGVGPRLARNILSGISADELAHALSNNDVSKLKSIPGIGSKTAERLVIELRDKAAAIKPEDKGFKAHGLKLKDEMYNDILSALLNLGYKSHLAERALERIKTTENQKFDALLKEALKMLAKG